MRPSNRGVAAGVTLVIALGAGPLNAQQTEPATIPTALANALIAPYGRLFGARPHFVVARAPGGWPATLRPPAPAELIGGMTFGPMLAVVYRFPRQVNAEDAVQRVLAGAGFARAAAAGEPRGGFTSGHAPESTAWCGASGVANVQEVDSTATTRSVLVTLISGQAVMTLCDRSVSPSDRMKPPLEIPTLSAPPGVTASADGMGWSGETMRTSVHIDTTVSPDVLLEHYVRQLTDAGWQVGKRLSDGGTALQPLSVRDANGRAWVGALTLVTAADRRTLMLDMMPATSERGQFSR